MKRFLKNWSGPLVAIAVLGFCGYHWTVSGDTAKDAEIARAVASVDDATVADADNDTDTDTDAVADNGETTSTDGARTPASQPENTETQPSQ